MELLFATVIAACVGLLVRYITPGRDTYGSMLLPALAGAVTAATWVILVWIGFTFDGGWIWAISLTTGIVAAFVTALILPARRRRFDTELLEALSRP